MKVSLIVAVSESGVIGRKNSLPWHLPEDMKLFRKFTMGHCVLMGRKNFESLPDAYRPLPGRTNLVLSRDPGFYAGSALVFSALEDALQFARDNGESELFVIGGEQIYKASFEYVTRVYLTRVHADLVGDAYFDFVPDDSWKESGITFFPKDERHKYAFTFSVFEKIVQ